MPFHHNPTYIHHQAGTPRTEIIREVIFGMEDGMVSTMGAVTGIAVGSKNHFIVLLSGFVIIAVESISMAVGSYLSNKSEKEIDERKMNEERQELKEFPNEEKKELEDMYVKDGWPKNLAPQMAEAASQNHDLFLQEMAYRELRIIPDETSVPLHNGIAMGVSYVVGGSISLIPYFLIPSISSAVPVSVVVTLVGLFTLGAYTTKYSRRAWWKAGLEMLLLASAAALIGFTVGQAVDSFLVQ